MSETELTPRDGQQTRRKLLRAGAADLRLVGIAVVVIYGLVFAALNTHRAEVNFVFGSTRVSVIWVILLSVALGFVLGVLLPQLRRHRRGRQN